MNEDDRATLNALADCCDQVIDAFAAFGDHTNWRPAKISPLRYEQQAILHKYGPSGAWDDEPRRFAAENALFLLPVARQHLAAMAQLLRSGHVIFSVAPVARAILEILGRVVWLLDPSANPRQRAARTALARVDDLQRTKGTALALKHVKLASRSGQQLHELRRHEIPARFFKSEIILLKSGELVIAEQQYPGLRDSVNLLDAMYDTSWNAGGLYDFLSFATHPNLAFALQMVDRVATSSDSQPASTRFNFVMRDLTYPRRLVRNVAVTFADVWDLAAQYHGLKIEGRSSLLDRIEAATAD